LQPKQATIALWKNLEMAFSFYPLPFMVFKNQFSRGLSAAGFSPGQ